MKDWSIFFWGKEHIINLNCFCEVKKTHHQPLQIPLAHVLEGPEGELGTHPQSPGWPNVGHNLNLESRFVKIYILFYIVLIL